MKAFAVAAAIAALAASAGAASGAFQCSVGRITPAVRDRIVGSSWNSGCPVPIRKLRIVRVSIHKFDGSARLGRMIIHRREAHDVVTVMRKLWRHDYPIRRMRLIDAYGAKDRRSMRHDNTSAFNCRYVSGTNNWSMHARGLAIDLNPVENPYVSGSYVSPANGAKYADRCCHPAIVHANDGVVRAFASIGWGWGGIWSSPDYQHFSSNGS